MAKTPREGGMLSTCIIEESIGAHRPEIYHLILRHDAPIRRGPWTTSWETGSTRTFVERIFFLEILFHSVRAHDKSGLSLPFWFRDLTTSSYEKTETESQLAVVARRVSGSSRTASLPCRRRLLLPTVSATSPQSVYFALKLASQVKTVLIMEQVALN